MGFNRRMISKKIQKGLLLLFIACIGLLRSSSTRLSLLVEPAAKKCFKEVVNKLEMTSIRWRVPDFDKIRPKYKIIVINGEDGQQGFLGKEKGHYTIEIEQNRLLEFCVESEAKEEFIIRVEFSSREDINDLSHIAKEVK